MSKDPPQLPSNSDSQFNIYHELMARKIRKILLVFSPYDAFIMEQEGSLTSKIVSEYRGLNLSHPPRLTGASTTSEAIQLVSENSFDLIITMPQLGDIDCFSLGKKIKKIKPHVPVILLAHSVKDICPLHQNSEFHGIDRQFVWSSDPDFLMSLVKNVEDHLNAVHDTRKAMVRILLLVEDSPLYRSVLLPIIYKEIVKQTQAVLDESLNLEHRLLKMRARPKILVSENYEDAMQLFHRFKPYIFGILSDVSFPRQGKMDKKAGKTYMTHIRKEIPDLPLLMLSSESGNRHFSEQIPAAFLDKNSPVLRADLRNFFINHLGFGDFVFRLPNGKEVDRAKTLSSLEKKLVTIPDESLAYHIKRNHFSNWVMARSEVTLAHVLRGENLENTTVEHMRDKIISTVRNARRIQQKGVVGQFSSNNFDPDIYDFVKIGQGSLGGKALGLSFMAKELNRSSSLHKNFPNISIKIPQTLVITTDGFNSFIAHNGLKKYRNSPKNDQAIAKAFLDAEMPERLKKDLTAYLKKTRVPLTIRSSSVLEDSQYKPYAGLYKTYMVPNNSDDLTQRLEQLLKAIKLVYASTFYEGPSAFSKSTFQSNEDSMAVIIQHLVGREYGDFFYPAISGTAQSHNYYPVSYMKPEEGIAHIAMGFGKTVVEGEQNLRFSPHYPKILPQFSSVDDILTNSQRYFYSLRTKNYPPSLHFHVNSNLEKHEIIDAPDDYPFQMLTSTYFHNEDRIRDIQGNGAKIVTFAQILKHNIFPLPSLLSEILAIGQKGMGCAIEIEFAADLATEKLSNEFYLLQIRPMVAGGEYTDVEISEDDISHAFCHSAKVLGHGRNDSVTDIVYVKSADFNPRVTKQAASEIASMNGYLIKKKRPYLLIGPGRWGSADPWLGIPVQWQDISGVVAMVEVHGKDLSADPSQGTHFFQNITALGIQYFTADEVSGEQSKMEDFINLEWLHSLPAKKETQFLCHISLKKPILIKVDGRRSQGVILAQ